MTSNHVTAFELLQRNLTGNRSILTFSTELNNILDDGFPVGRVIELAGEAGTGKTQICFQLCVSVQLPEDLGGLEAEAVFIDTEDTFRTTRIAEISQNAMTLMRDSLPDISVEKMMDNVHYMRCKEFHQLRCIVHNIDKFLISRPKVKLVIFDSIAYHFRYDFNGNVKERKRIVHQITHRLKKVAYERDVCIIVTNHIAYDPMTSKVHATLGKNWQHFPFVRLYLEKFEGTDKRRASIIKSPIRAKQSIFYKITNQGITDVVEAISQPITTTE